MQKGERQPYSQEEIRETISKAQEKTGELRELLEEACN
jgi:hypothetical protein